jgi:hypothetical protein
LRLETEKSAPQRRTIQFHKAVGDPASEYFGEGVDRPFTGEDIVQVVMRIKASQINDNMR